jgi:hypothetical protein
MSEENNGIIDKDGLESENPQQYYIEGYFDTAFSMPAETEQTYSYRIKASSALPAFPPHNNRKPDEGHIRPVRSIVLFTAVLLIVILLTMVVRLVIKYDLEITRDNGTIHIMISQRYTKDELTNEIRPAQTDPVGIVNSNENERIPVPKPSTGM